MTNETNKPENKSAEEILNRNTDEEGIYLRSDVLEAMEEYASQQVSIALKEKDIYVDSMNRENMSLIDDLQEMNSELEASRKINENVKIELIDVCEFFGKMKESYTEHEMELFLISIGNKLNNCLTQYQKSKKK